MEPKVANKCLFRTRFLVVLGWVVCSNTPSAPAGATKAHSKGEGKLQKVVKRLVFGTLLLVTLCVIVASGHLATLGLVQVHAPSAPRHTRLAMHHALHRALRPKP